MSKIAIVGMEMISSQYYNLNDFENNIYEGKGHDPEQKRSNLERESFSVKIPAQTLKQFNPQQKLILQVVDRALEDAEVKQGANVAVMVASEAEKEQTSIRTSMANYLCQLWGFTGQPFTLAAAETSAFKALEMAQILLAAGKVETVLVGMVGGQNASTSDLSASAVVLKSLETAQKDENNIYALIESISINQYVKGEQTENDFGSHPREAVAKTCQQALHMAQVDPKDIGYLEIVGSGDETARPMADHAYAGLGQAYETCEALSCALSQVARKRDSTNITAGIASLIKSALCLYYRYIPAFPPPGQPEPQTLQDSPFYIASESRPWFSDLAVQRLAAINSINTDATEATYTHIILGEELNQRERDNNYLTKTSPYLFPLAGDDLASLTNQLQILENAVATTETLSDLARQNFATYRTNINPIYTVAIVARNLSELTREIKHAFSGVTQGFEQQKDWQTPVGSYFTPEPLGKKGKVAYVYPGGFNAHLGLSRSLFRLFPQIYDNTLICNLCNRIASIEKVLYPRSTQRLSRRQLERLEQRLLDDPLTMLESETGFAGLMSTVLRDYFRVQPQGSFGYSLGETSMMFSQGVWRDFEQTSTTLNSSSLFKSRLSGSKDAVREHWQLPKEEGEDGDFWSTYLVMADVSQVKERLQGEKHVYLTQINTSKEVVIAGESQSCQRVIESLNCGSFRAPFNHVIHCEAMDSEYEELVKLNSLAVQSKPEITFYSATEYAPIPLTQESISHNLAQNLCQQLDFPRLVNRVYKDDFRIFVEVGAGNNCSRWIGEILKSQQHTTISLNRRGIDDHTGIVRALAKLVSHRVDLDLYPLYYQTSKINHHKSKEKKMPVTVKPTTKPNHLPESLAGENMIIPTSFPTQELFTEKFFYQASGVSKSHQTFLEARQKSLKLMSEMIKLQGTCAEKSVNPEA